LSFVTLHTASDKLIRIYFVLTVMSFLHAITLQTI